MENITESMDNTTENSFAALSREQIVDLFEKMLNDEPVESLRRTVEAMKIAFYRNQEVAESTEEVVDEAKSELESKFKGLMAKYRTLRDAHIAEQDQQREFNLKAKLQVIEELKELVESDETQTLTFNKFRELQERWRAAGQVPVANLKDIWEQYNYQIERFYGVIKINRELRDLDQKKNLEAKTSLCERAEALIEMSNVIESFRELQLLHDEWREIGPVDVDSKEAIWGRFKEATTTINKRHATHFDTLRGEQEQNLQRKAELCERIEACVANQPKSHNSWNKSSEELQAIQQEWRTIGFAPKKDNTPIYNRFRAACDAFFAAKREFYAASKDEHSQNLAAKVALCEAAEALAQSEDWKTASDELIKLQGEWKSVGAVSRRDSDKIWKRFRAACDIFFERKASRFSSENNDQQANLAAKEEIIAAIEGVVASGKIDSIDVIKSYQRKWSDIGFVPIKSKEALQTKYKEVVDEMFKLLRSEESSRNIGAYRNRIEGMKGNKSGVSSERDKLSQRLKQVKLDIIQLENNMGFFAKSKGAEGMIADVQRKIEAGRREIEQIKEKIKLIDIAERN